jgi:ankyrin repeat protein
MFAIKHGCMNHPFGSSISVLMWAHPDLAIRDSNGWTALHYAAQCEYGKSVVESLLLREADVNVRDNAGMTPLDHALARNLTKMADVLRSHGCKIGRELAEE